MKKITLAILSLIGICLLVAAISLYLHDRKEYNWYHESWTPAQRPAPDSVATVCILATVHQPTKNYNADSIVNILRQFQPDLILTEEDTLLFEKFHLRYEQNKKKSIFARVGRSFGFGLPEEIEGRAVRKYKISMPAVDIRPFDYEGRNAFYQRFSILSMETRLSLQLERLAKHKQMTDSQSACWQTLLSLNKELDHWNSLTPNQINQSAFYALTEKRQDQQYHQLALIINGNERMRSFREFFVRNAAFWDIRNKTMASHILNFIRLYPGKRIMVLTGSMHKYYLLKELEAAREDKSFRVVEYYENR